MKHIKYLTIITVAALALCSCGKKAKVAFTTTTVEYHDLHTDITATGTIEPVTQVEVGTQVSGIIDKIYVDYNSVVKKGQVIAELDKTNLQSELTSAQSNLANAQSSLTYQKANYERYKTLYDKGLVAANDYEQARLNYEQARQQVIVQQQNVQKAQTNLGYATITAPIDGVVLSKEVEEGQTVASSMTTPTLFILAQDLTQMRVIADVDEADIGEVKEGQRVTFTVDAFPDDTFSGVVQQVRQEATTTSNVVTYEVVITAPNDDLKLKPGLTANVTIYTMEKNHVLSVLSKALRFTPTEMMADSIIDCDSPQKLWTMAGPGTLKAIPVTTGVVGGTYTEILSGAEQGQKVITGFTTSADEQVGEDEEASNPFMPGPPGRNKNKK
ncbi:MAG: efflux RND transporter periplasmic adaptor subunit [Bacteroidales bacterium]|nr:efflux RND transporter periplasmic adaptor subunit [Bacteroidales bacterium]